MKIDLLVTHRHRKEYRADLLLNGILIGYVERGFVQGGFHSDEYKAVWRGSTVATGRTLSDLKVELAEWVKSNQVVRRPVNIEKIEELLDAAANVLYYEREGREGYFVELAAALKACGGEDYTKEA